MADKKVTVACPHCGSTGTHPMRVTQDGSFGCRCDSCSKSFTVDVRNGSVYRVTK